MEIQLMQTEDTFNIVDEGFGYTLTITWDTLSGSVEYYLVDDSGEEIEDHILLTEILNEMNDKLKTKK